MRARTPAIHLREERRHIQALAERLRTATCHRLHAASQQIKILSGSLHALSPLATLDRGFAILRRPADGAILRAREAVVGESVEALLSEGRLLCEIKAISALDSSDSGLSFHR